MMEISTLHALHLNLDHATPLLIMWDVFSSFNYNYLNVFVFGTA
jgi:hypothetical protein